MDAYYVSAIVFNNGCSKPWLLEDCSCNLTLEEAMKEIADIKTKFTTLSAWIYKFDENNTRQTVFHECYVDAFGNIK